MEGLNYEPSELASDRPSLTFEDGSYSIPELLESHLLPVVVQYDSDSQPLPFSDLNFDISQPLLLYKKRNIQKVAARSLCVEDGKYAEIGESLLVPEDYKGWFAVLQRVTGNQSADDNVPHFTSIEELANSNTEKFLIGGTKKINGLQIISQSESHLNHEQRHFLPGDILTREKIYYGESKKRTRLFRKPKYITEKFLLCRDESDRDILLPFEQTGIFYQISHRSGKANKNVMQMSDIVARKLTPRIIKLVYGRFPISPCSFTGLMKAEFSSIETSIIASTIVHKKNVLLEIPVASEIRFRVAETNDELRKNPCFKSAKTLCAEKASTYMRNIKVCYNFADGEEGANAEQIALINRSTSMSLNSPPPKCINEYVNVLENFHTNTQKKENLKDEKGKSSKKLIGESMSRNGSNESLTRNLSNIRLSDDISAPIVDMRPGRCISTGRMSFCLGNSYLTVPIYERTNSSKRDSGNNNTNPITTYTTRRGSRISFNGTFFEEEDPSSLPSVEGFDKDINIPPPLACTNISAYINTVSPPDLPQDSKFTDYRPTSASRRPSTQPPDVAPPPLPSSCSTSGVSSGSSSSVSDEVSSKRGSSGSFDYDVPKIEKKDPSVIRSNITEGLVNTNDMTEAFSDKPRFRRPSTFTFSEGCLQSCSSFSNSNFPSIVDEEEIENNDHSPIYENIKTLMEIVAKLENRDEEFRSLRGVGNEENDNYSEHGSSPSRPKTSQSMDYPNEECEDTVSEESDYDEDQFRKDHEHVCTTDTDDSNPTLKLHKNVRRVGVVSHRPLVEMNEFLTMPEQNIEINSISTSDDPPALEIQQSVCSKSHPSAENDVDLTYNMKFEHTDEEILEQSLVKSSANVDQEFEETVKRNKDYLDENNDHDTVEYLSFDNENKLNFETDSGATEASGETTESFEVQEESEDKVKPKELTRQNILEHVHECEETTHKQEGESEQSVSDAESQYSECSSVGDEQPRNEESHWRAAVRRRKREGGSTRRKIAEVKKHFSVLTVEEISNELKEIGIKEDSINTISQKGINGAILAEVLDGDVSLRDILVGVNLVDQQKISMFIRGWRPNVES